MLNKISKVTIFSLYFIFNALLLYLYIDSYLTDLPHLGEDGYFAGFGLMFALVVIYIGIIGNVIITIVDLIIFLIVRRKIDKKQKRFYKIMLFVPMLTELFLIFFPITEIINFFYFM